MKSLLSFLPFFRSDAQAEAVGKPKRPGNGFLPSSVDMISDFVEKTATSWDKAANLVNTVIAKAIAPFHKSVAWGDRLLTLDKSMGFMQDPVFRKCFADFNGKHAYDQYMGPEGIAWRLNTLLWAARRALPLQGDLVECGVFKGDMAWVLVNCLSFHQVPKTFYLYDTFAGFAPDYSSAADFVLSPSLFESSNAAYKIPNLYEQVKGRFTQFANVKVVQGICPDILTECSPTQISFLHIDLNSPAAEVGVLEKLFDRVVQGGIIIFDDYGWIDYQKQKMAEDEFMVKQGLEILELPTGQGLVVKT